MSANSESEKSAGKRIEEAQKWNAETERSLAVAKAKEAHSLIEEIEKDRKRPLVFSIRERLLRHALLVNDIAKKLLERKSQHSNFEIDIPKVEYIQNLIKIYRSIRYDFKKSLELRDDDMEQMFKELDVYFAGFEQTINEMESIFDQMMDMATFCKRLM